LRSSSAPPEIKAAQAALEDVTRLKDEAIAGQDYEAAARLRDEEAQGKEGIEAMRAAWHDDQSKETPIVTDEDIAQVVSMWTGIPVIRISAEESERLLHMEDALHGRVIGQQEAIQTISRAVRRARAGLKDPKRPIGSFIFMGPTGTGKTLLARALAEFMFGSEDALIKIDMSEFMERHNVSRLVGAPPGYVGYDEGGQLTEAVRRKSYSVVVLDEIEKAHPEVFNILLQILEDGHLTDAKGRRVDFRNTVIIMTSNVGAQLLQKDTSIGFRAGASESAQEAADYDKMKEKVLGELKNTFRPEFLNRIDATVVFRSLTREEIRLIVDLLLERVKGQLAGQEMELVVTDAAKDAIIAKGYDQAYGARPLRREIQNQIEDALAERMLQASFSAGDTVTVDVGPDGTLTIEKASPPAKRQPARAGR
ncbi:MAG: AAA family ATPase, partial [Candidatus Limnocylindria bacterium]